MVSVEDDCEFYEADIVRIICGDGDFGHPGLKFAPVETTVNKRYPSRRQPIRAGSYVTVADTPILSNVSSFTLQVLVWPTLPGSGEQSLLGRWVNDEQAGFVLCLDSSGAPTLRIGAGPGTVKQLSSNTPLMAREWAVVTGSFDSSSGEAMIWQRSLAAYPVIKSETRCGTSWPGGRVGHVAAPFMMAAYTSRIEAERAVPDGLFNGKLEAPCLIGRALDAREMESLDPGTSRVPQDCLVLGAWDFSRDIGTDRVSDRSMHGHHGRTVNLPTRAVRGHSWNGETLNWQEAPAHYAAIHFHEDDLLDAAWEEDFALTLPETMKSGIYAARLRVADDAEHVVFFVRPPRGKATADVAFLAPTASYMAYANNHAVTDGRLRELAWARLTELRREDLFLNEHREYGLSLYDSHKDGSAVFYSSRLRPILVNMRPGNFPWQFSADTHITDWLESNDYAYDIVTDEDLHDEGLSALKPYRTVITGTHPEYTSCAMLDALSAYLDGGGRLMYLGGNGFYWRTAFHPTLPGVIEVRRAENGTRASVAEPGEYYMAFTGEYGGMWRAQGRPPQKLVGTGFTAQGCDRASWYRRLPDSFSPRAAFIFEGIGDDELIGDFGLVLGGAAGFETDRFDKNLGTPPHALLLASSECHTNAWFLAVEDVTEMGPALDGLSHSQVRADMVFFETHNGGGVFSTGSITWAGSLSHAGYDNNVSRITANVLDRFLDETPL